MKKIISVILTILLSSMLIACGSSKPEDVALNYVKAAFDGDADEMLSQIYIPDSAKQRPGSEEIITGKIKAGASKAKEQAERKGGVKNIEVVEKEIDEANGLAKVVVNVKFKNDQSQSDSSRVKLIKNDNKWKVDL